MLGLLAYLPTFAYIPHIAYLLLLPFLIWRNRSNITDGVKTLIKEGDTKVNTNFLILFCFVVGALLNRIAYLEMMTGLQDFFPFCILILLCYWSGISIRRQDLKMIVYCVGLEAVFIIIEYYLGISTVFKGLELSTEFGDSHLLYSNRPLGLSTNSSIVALKLLLGYLILDFAKLKGKLFLAIKIAILIGVVLTFNRSTIVAILVYHTILMFRNFVKLKWPLKRVILFCTIGVVGFCVVGYLAYAYVDVLISQFTRDQGTIELSGRDKVWKYYFGFIGENLMFGNGSYKLWFGRYHAHNSFIQLVATHGIVLSLFYLVLIVRGVNNNNVVFVLPILIYSLAQYGVFWGISLMDIVFFAFLYGKGKASLSIDSQTS